MSPIAVEATEAQSQSRFLALPTEIRQKILLFTITDQDLVSRSIRLNCGKTGKYDEYIQYWVFGKSYVEFWAGQLRLIHPIVRNEMGYVLKKWLDRGNKLLNDRPYIYYDLRGRVLTDRIGCSST